MVFDIDMIRKRYETLPQKIDQIKRVLGSPLTATEKILYTHLSGMFPQKPYQRGVSYVDFAPDRIALQDATAQMALLQFMQAGKKKVAVPTTVHCDHLIQAKVDAKADLDRAIQNSSEVFDFLSTVSNKYGVGFWKPGAGIIHQVVLENYAFPGGMMIGTDSHTVNAGGLGMIAIGVGGADAVDVMSGMPWELKFPKLIGVKLTGRLNGWTSPKDIILKVAGILTVKGGTGMILEYFGSGAQSLSCTGKATICNMGAEIGATTSIFGYDESMDRYLRATGRAEVADMSEKIAAQFTADPEVYEDPHAYFDQVIEVDLDSLEPHLNGPFSPDLATPLSEMKDQLKKESWPENVEVALIGSCTNSSYEDISRAASIAEEAITKNLKPKAQFTITPGSEQVRYTIERDGFIETFEKVGAKVFANACGPCIGMWDRVGAEKKERNTIVHSFNRNFAKRADGNPNTHAFVGSPELVTAIAFSGRLDFDPRTDQLLNQDGDWVSLSEPKGFELPQKGFDVKEAGYQSPLEDGTHIEVNIAPDSERLQLLEPFDSWDGNNILGMRLLIKAFGKCTTDHISMAGAWLRYRGHLDNISNNCLIGAVNAFNQKVNSVKNQFTQDYGEVPVVQRFYKSKGVPTLVVGDHNYGEGSSREHAAMEPRHLGVKIVLVKSFARIHETNLKKQGMLALTFETESDYDKIKEDDVIDTLDLDLLAPDRPIKLLLYSKEGTDKREIICKHSYNQSQIEWFKYGSALNKIKEENL